MAQKGDSQGVSNTDSVERTGIPNPFTELATSFRELKGAPRGFWYTNYMYWMDGVAYFGMLTLLAMYFHDILGMSDDAGHKIVSAYMALITGFMLIFGPISDKLGVRKSLLVSVVLYIIGRTALPLALYSDLCVRRPVAGSGRKRFYATGILRRRAQVLR